MEINYYGHSTVDLVDGDTRTLIDPFLKPNNPAAEVSADRSALRRVMAAVGARPHLAKIALAWAGEKAGRLKLNGRLVDRSPLTAFVELEAVEVGIYGKLLMWRALRDRRPAGSEVVDLDALIARAERQLGDVALRRVSAGSALQG